MGMFDFDLKEVGGFDECYIGRRRALIIDIIGTRK